MNDIKLRPALYSEKAAIWDILAAAIERRKADGSQQWQDGYPNEEVVANDLKENYGYVLENSGVIVGYCALILNNEPAYAAIDGRWLTNVAYFGENGLSVLWRSSYARRASEGLRKGYFINNSSKRPLWV
jgi:acetyltransferase, GNAT family